MNVDWTSVTSWVTIIAALTAIIALWLENRWSRLSMNIDLFWRAEERFRHHDQMIEKRGRASAALLKGEICPELDEVLNYFEFIGFWVRRRVFDREMAWHSFYNSALAYWFAAQDHILEVRSSDPTIWQDYHNLVDQLMKVESRKSHQSRETLKPSREWLDQVLVEESSAYPIDAQVESTLCTQDSPNSVESQVTRSNVRADIFPLIMGGILGMALACLLGCNKQRD